MAICQDEFPYDDDNLLALESTISGERLSTYMVPGGFDKRRAVRFYLWNARLSESLLFPLQTAEVTLRNSIHQRLNTIYGADWPHESRFARYLKEKGRDNICKVERRIERSGHDITVGRIVAGLPFEFWANLFGPQFVKPLWRDHLRETLPHLPVHLDHADIRRNVLEIKELRNRVAHYEPIFKRDLSREHSGIVNLIGYCCPRTAHWTRHHSTFQRVLRQRP